MKKAEIQNKIKQAVQKIAPHSRIILYGSRARGDNDKYSDWDVLILTHDKVNEPIKRQIRDQIFEVELDTEQVITSIIHNFQEWESYTVTPLYERVQNEGIEL